MNDNNLLKAALAYLSSGLSIIPIGIGTDGSIKKPLIKWQEFQQRKATPEEVENWFQKYDVKGIGIVTGEISDLLVLDIDTQEVPEDIEFLETPQVSTGRGFHYYFKYPKGTSLKNTAGFREKMDIRAKGGFVIAPPTIHKNGSVYSWIKDIAKIPLAEVPDWLISELTRPKFQEIGGSQKVAPVEEGRRNQTAAKLVGKLLKQNDPTEWEEKVWPELMSWNGNNTPPLPEQELRAVYESIRSREIEQRVVSVTPVTQTPQSTKVNLLEEEITLEQVLEKTRLLGIPDYVVEIVLSVYLSVFLPAKKNPLWLMIVGVPSSNKTTALNIVQYAKDVYRLDTLTQTPFTSGSKASDKPVDLLPLLDKKCLIIKDYTTIFGMQDEVVKKILSEMVSIYDGEYAKHSPLRGTVRYNVSFSHIGAVTLAGLNRRQQYMNLVGARFLQLRLPSLNNEDRDLGLDKIWTDDFNDLEHEANLYASSFVTQMKDKISEAKFNIPPNIQNIVNRLAKLTARARGIIETEKESFINDEGKEITYYAVKDKQIEEPFRAASQLKTLLLSTMLVRGKNTATMEEVELLKKVTLSSMPVRRSEALEIFKAAPSHNVKSAVSSSGQGSRTARRHLDELVELGILEVKKEELDVAKTYTVKEEFREIICDQMDDTDKKIVEVFGAETLTTPEKPLES